MARYATEGRASTDCGHIEYETQDVEVFGKLSTLVRPHLGAASRVQLAVIAFLTIEQDRAHRVRHTPGFIARAISAHIETVRKALIWWEERGVLIRHDRGPGRAPRREIAFGRVVARARRLARRAAPRPPRDETRPPAPARGNTRSPSCSPTQPSGRSSPARGRAGGAPIPLGTRVPGPPDIREVNRVRTLIRGGMTPREAAKAVALERYAQDADALRRAGMSARMATRLAAVFTGARIRDVVQERRRRGDRLTNPAGWMVEALRRGWRFQR